MSSRRFAALSVLLAAGLLTGCGSDGGNASRASSTGTDVPSASSSTTSGASGAEQVSANDATYDELVDALDAAGVVPADQWAREVEEYRPYPADDPSFAKLRQELAKYNPSQDTVENIVNALSLP